MKVSYMTGLWGSYNQGFLRSGVLQPGVQMNVYYMTSLCSDVDIDRKNLVRIVRSDVNIDLTMSHPC